MPSPNSENPGGQIDLRAKSEEPVATSDFLANSDKRKAKSCFPITAFVLAGGRSSRMGSDKALLSFGNQNLLQRALQAAVAVSSKAYIVGSKQLYGGFGAIVEDIYPGCGPLGGIHAALSSTDTDLNLILSVDMPRMTAEFLRWLVAKAETKPELITVPDVAGGLQPLCGTYRKAIAGVAEQVLQQGTYKVGQLFSRVPTCVISEGEILAAGFSPELFQNINTPEEYANCRS
jgi:molybdopterin-guanine dinucleotide biosynthesis protein A